ncbi:ubiquitin family protein [Crateriforma conspicua]|uniref:hypothetical protein n=1 Tax=Crateriforma conspicua TaxID=2527996 RepID=UPI00118C1B5B|nr:hypothetical protein [Crateriforma conspicua]QDV61728.1 hypothetical protein Mal65_08550 [Crateriforma conspicua]
MSQTKEPAHNVQTFFWVMVCGLTSIAIVLGVARYRSTKAQLTQLRSDAADVSKWASDIRAAARRPKVAALQAESPSHLAVRIEAALEQSSTAPTQLMSVEPQAPSRVPRSDYTTRTTLIELRGVTLRQLAVFARALPDPEQGMAVPQLNLTPATANQRNQEVWDAQLTLTQLIFSPISDS